MREISIYSSSSSPLIRRGNSSSGSRHRINGPHYPFPIARVRAGKAQLPNPVIWESGLREKFLRRPPRHSFPYDWVGGGRPRRAGHGESSLVALASTHTSSDGLAFLPFASVLWLHRVHCRLHMKDLPRESEASSRPFDGRYLLRTLSLQSGVHVSTACIQSSTPRLNTSPSGWSEGSLWPAVLANLQTAPV
jgi:hypothetical protein